MCPSILAIISFSNGTVDWWWKEMLSCVCHLPSWICKVVQFSSVSHLCPILCDPMDCNTSGFPVPHQLPEFTQTHVHQVVIPSSHLILCHLLLLPPSIFCSIRVFSNESVLYIRWPKYWSFSFSISPSNEHPGLISFRMNWLDLLAVQGTLRSLLQHQVQKHQFFGAQHSQFNSHIYTWPQEKP